MKRARLILALVLIVAFLPPSLMLARRMLLDSRRSPAGAEVLVEVPKGAGVMQVGRLLKQAGVIEGPWMLALAARLTGQAGRLRAGEYSLGPAMSLRQIVAILAAGRVVLHQALIPEGFTLEQIVDRLAGLRLLERDRALELARDPAFIAGLGLKGDSLEGYLFPDTYRLARGLGARAVLAALVRRFQQEWEALDPAAQALGLSRREAVTLASIVEREAQVEAERPLISAVYLNRLRLGMKLQADPTVLYGLSGTGGGPTREDLARDHAYNTYTREGLPPGPICSPGLASLRAAVRPAQVDYLYFVARGDGSHAFSVDYRDQVNNVIRLRRQQRGR